MPDEFDILSPQPERLLRPTASDLNPIDSLKPESDKHKKVLDYLLERIRSSEEAMSAFYPRWAANERRIQAYISLPDWEELLKQENQRKGPLNITQITIPYSFAVISSIVTFLMHLYTARKPLFAVDSYRGDTKENARNMETLLQYNADHSRLIRHLFQFLQDGQIYGLGILRTNWREEKGFRTIRRRNTRLNSLGGTIGSTLVESREERIVYQGNEVFSVDPFLFFPDPRVPMSEVNKRGEYVFWRTYESVLNSKRERDAGNWKWVEAAGNIKNLVDLEFPAGQSARAVLAGGDAQPGLNVAAIHKLGKNFHQVDQGTVDLIPAELGLSESRRVEKWLFTILNKKQIVQAEPFQVDHGMHPIVIAEPYSLGYSFGQPGMADYLGPIQDHISWLLNSHIDNVRKVLRDTLVVDPGRIEMQDVKSRQGIIRLKRAAIGQDVSTAIQQLQVIDVTAGHIKDAAVMLQFGERIAAVTDNILGLQDGGGRKSATEVRTSSQNALSRLSKMGMLISSQAIVDLTEQMSLNTQQFMSETFMLQVLGEDGLKAPVTIGPEHVVGDFYFPIHDGVLPLDKIALLDIWKEIFIAVRDDEELRQTYPLPRIFEWIADLGGAENLKSFRVNIQSDQEVASAAQAGNLVPTTGGRPTQPRVGQPPSGSAPSGFGVRGIPNRPRDRLTGGT